MTFNCLRKGQRFRAYGLAGIWVKTDFTKARPIASDGASFSLATAVIVRPIKPT